MKRTLLFAGLLICVSGLAQVRLVKNHNGNFSSNVLPKFVLNNKLIYAAINGDYDVFHSDGTTNGSSYVLDSNNLRAHLFNSGSNFPYVILNGEAHFVANFYSVATGSYSRLTKAGFTNTVCDGYADLSTFTGTNISELAYPVVLNNEILFAPSLVQGGNAVGVELYKSTGTSISLVKDINPNNLYSSNPSKLTILGTNCFFSADDGTNGGELWKTDGTTSGTNLYLDLNTGSASSNPDFLNVISSQLTFVATHSTLGRELFKTNGSGSLVLIKDINTAGDSNPTNVTDINGTLYFSANNGSIGQELWKSNGLNSGTFLIKDINPSGNSNPSKFTILGSTIFFVADDGTNGTELWKTDGTPTGTVLVKDINTSGASNPTELIEYNGKLYFTADNGVNGRQLWVTDGTSIGTSMITINPSATSNCSNLIVYNNELYFAADAGTGIGKELYAYMDPVLSINQFTLNKNAITISPNPSKNYFEVTTELNIEKVEVYSMLGQLLKTFDKQDQYYVSDLVKGTYFIKTNTELGIVTKKLLID